MPPHGDCKLSVLTVLLVLMGNPVGLWLGAVFTLGCQLCSMWA
jgi:hypothetical protein